MQNQPKYPLEDGARSRRLGYGSVNERVEYAANLEVAVRRWIRELLETGSDTATASGVELLLEILSYSEISMRDLPGEIAGMGIPVMSEDTVGVLLDTACNQHWLQSFLMHVFLGMRKETLDSVRVLIDPEV